MHSTHSTLTTCIRHIGTYIIQGELSTGFFLNHKILPSILTLTVSYFRGMKRIDLSLRTVGKY